MADTSWQPKGNLERLAWPFVVSADARRAGQLPLRQVIWAVAYAMFIAWAVTAFRNRRATAPAMDSRARYVVATLGIGFVIWMSAFGVYRYLVALELLAPLVVFILGTHSFPRHGRTIAAWALSIAALVVVTGGMKTGGHADWDEVPFALDVPAIGAPAKATVLLVGGDPPWAWIGAALPVEVALAQVGGNFPEGPAFKPRLASMVVSRGGPVFAVVSAHRDNSVAAQAGLTRSAGGCSFLRVVVRTFRMRFEVVDDREGACALEVAVDSPRDIEAENRLEREKAARMLAAYGFALDESSCALHIAKLAAEIRVLQWCSAAPKRAARAPAG